MPDRKQRPGRSSAPSAQRLKDLKRENEALKAEIAHHHEVRESLASERDKLRSLVDGLGRTEIGIDIIGVDHRIHFQNRVLEERFGALDDKPCYVKYMGAHAPCPECPMTSAVSLNRLESRELVGQDGRDYRVLSAPFVNPDGTVDKVIEVVIDVTERRKAEEALRDRQGLLNRAQQIAHLGSWEFDIVNNRLAWSDEVYRIFGLQPQEFAATYEAFLDAVHPDDRAAVDSAYSDSLVQGSAVYEIEHRIVRKPGGEVRFVHERCEHIRDESGRVIKSIGMVRDITERRKADQMLQESERMFRSLVENSHAGIFIVADDFRFAYANEMFCTILGYPHNEVIGRDFRSVLDSESLELVADRYLKRQRGETVPPRYEFNIIRQNGAKRRVEISSTVVMDSAGKTITLAQLLDITERKKAEEELRESERKLAGIVRNIPGVVFQFRVRKDGTSYFSYVSPRATEIFGLSSDPNSPDWDVGLGARVHPEDRDDFLKSIGKSVARRSEWSYEGRILMPDGGFKWLQGMSSPTQIGDELVFDGVLLDIGERKRAEEGLQAAHAELENRVQERTAELQKANSLLLQEIRQRREAEEKRHETETKYRDLVESANSIILELDTRGRVTFFNTFAQQFFGFPESEIIGRPVVGTIVPKTDSQGNDLRSKIMELVRHPEKYHNSENENIRRNGDKVWIAWTNKGLYDKKGRLKEVLCIGIDRTEYKRAAEMLAQQEMEKAAMAERQRLARDLHDAVTQTLFSANLIAAVLPRLWAKDPAEGQHRLEELRQLTRGALAEMRMLLMELRPAALAEVGLVDLLRQLSEAATSRAGFPVSYSAEGACSAPLDVQVALYRVAQEALNNVLKHSGASEAAVRLLCRGNSADITITDNGAGFDPETVSPKHLGLRIMQERAEAVGAAVRVTSSEGRGTTVNVVWPDASRKEST